MAETISIGIQDFAKLRENNVFYIDKTAFIGDWWLSGDDVTLVTRPRRFGKTLNMSMLNAFFSEKYAGRGEELFGDLAIWKNGRMKKEQGAWPVIFLSFAGIKFTNYEDTRLAINAVIEDKFSELRDTLAYEELNEQDKKRFDAVCEDMPAHTAASSLRLLCSLLEKHCGRKAIVLLDEYDTPMQEAWIQGYWNELSAYLQALFNNTFKTNPHLARGLLTGITRVARESIFSDLNNPAVITTTSAEYETAFGFTEEEVFAAMDSRGMDSSMKSLVKSWYDGFTFGRKTDIYNPWSIICYLKSGELGTWWADTSSNGLISRLLQMGNPGLKETFERLLNGESIESSMDEQIVFSQLDGNTEAVWSLFVASGYLRVDGVRKWPEHDKRPVYTLSITNREVKIMFFSMIRRWFGADSSLSGFIRAMLSGKVREMNAYMNRIALSTFSSFDTGTHPGDSAPERFYHGFVLGLMADKAPDYIIRSNRESGFGQYDVVMEPRNRRDPAVIMEFKVTDASNGERELSDTVRNALKQIEDKRYDADLIDRGISEKQIYKYGFAFEEQRCLIGSSHSPVCQ